jgi:CheY-like chemotaxis protein
MPTAAQARREPLRVLLVEDTATDIFLLKTAFQEAGVPCQWHVVSDGHEAITVSSRGLKQCRFRPDLILLNFYLPGPHSLEILANFKRNPEWASIPAIVWSGLLPPSTLQSAKEAGAWQCLEKPNDLNGWLELPKLLQDHLAATE